MKKVGWKKIQDLRLYIYSKMNKMTRIKKQNYK